MVSEGVANHCFSPFTFEDHGRVGERTHALPAGRRSVLFVVRVVLFINFVGHLAALSSACPCGLFPGFLLLSLILTFCSGSHLVFGFRVRSLFDGHDPLPLARMVHGEEKEEQHRRNVLKLKRKWDHTQAPLDTEPRGCAL